MTVTSVDPAVTARRVTTLVTDEQWEMFKERAARDAVTMSDQLRALIVLYEEDPMIRERADARALRLAEESRRRRYGGT